MERTTYRAFLPLAGLSVCFTAGAVVGQVLALGAPDSTALALRQSLADYAQSGGRTDLTPASVLPTLVTWFRVPALAFLWGYTSLGVPLTCLTAAAFGFFLSFSLGCFSTAFGWSGVVLCASALGIRALIALPCFFLLSLSSMERAAWLFRLSAASRTRPEPRPDYRERRVCLAVCTLVLLAGAALDLTCTPRLLRLALDWMSGA